MHFYPDRFSSVTLSLKFNKEDKSHSKIGLGILVKLLGLLLVNKDTSGFTANTRWDEIAPYKTFIVKSKYKFGISDETKAQMAERDKVRKSILKAKNGEKAVLQAKYKKLRNLVNKNIRRDNIAKC